MRPRYNLADQADYRFWWWDDAVLEARARSKATGLRMRVFLDCSPFTGRLLWTVRAAKGVNA